MSLLFDQSPGGLFHSVGITDFCFAAMLVLSPVE
jgi:hypothetical protein